MTDGDLGEKLQQSKVRWGKI